MTGGIDTAVVRVRAADGAVLGAGFLLAPDLLCTCAHVLPGPDAVVTVDFPLLSERPRREATVLRWAPPAADNRGDLALLRLHQPAPKAAAVPWLAEEPDLWDRELRVFGFPQDRDDGLWAVVRSRGGQGTGWVQLEAGPGPRVRPGFSGAPLWDAARNCVVGFVVAVDSERTAYMHPTSALFAEWPDLRARLHPPNPYRGLAAFTEADAAVFHGRADDLARLVAAVREHPVVTVAGASGSGKSSLVHAGLIPVLRQQGVRVVAFRAGAEPELPAAPEPGTLVFADQFEELTAADPPAARALLSKLADLAERTPARPDGSWGLRAVLTLRPGGLEALLTAETRALLAEGQVLVPPMSRAQLTEVITGPLSTTPGVRLEPGLAGRILDEAGTDEGALPLVGFALQRLWDEQGHGNQLQHAVYERLGGVSGALKDHADTVYLGLSAADRVLAQRLLTEMTHPVGEQGHGRRPLPVAGLAEADRAVLTTLARHKLVVLTRPRGQEVADLVHEALIRHWGQLRGWLAEDREFATWHHRLRDQLTAWQDAEHDPGLRLRGAQLATAQEQAARHPDRLSPDDRDYIGHSTAAAQRQVRVLRQVIAVISVLALFTAGLTVTTVVSNNTLRTQARQQAARLLAQQSQRTAEVAADTSALTALAAWNHDPAAPEAYSALLQAHLRLRNVVGAVPLTVGAVKAMAASGDGSTVAVHGPDGGLEVVTGLDTPAPQVWQPPLPSRDVLLHRDAVSPDGRWLARLSQRGGVWLWNIRDRSGPVELRAPVADPRPEADYLMAVFDQDSERLLTHVSLIGQPDQLTIWDVVNRKEIPNRIPTDHISALNNVPPVFATGPDRDIITFPEITSGSAKNYQERTARRSISTGALVANGIQGPLVLDGSVAMHCGPDPDRRGEYRLEVRRVADGRIERTASIGEWSCLSAKPDVTRRYAVAATSGGDRVHTMVLVVDLSTGKRVIAPGPIVPPEEFPDRVVLPGPEGLTVASASGRRLLRSTMPPPGSQPDFRSPAELNLIATSRDDRHAIEFDRHAMTARLLDNIAAATGRELPAKVVTDLAKMEPELTFTTDGRALAGLAGSQLVVYDVPAMTERHRIELPVAPGIEDIRERFRGSISAVADNSLEVVYAGTASRWDPLTGRLLDQPHVLREDQEDLRWLAVRSKAAAVPGHPRWHIVLGKEQLIELWDLGTRARIGSFPGEPGLGQVSAVRFNDDGSRMAAMYGNEWDGTKSLRVWDVATRQVVHGRTLVPTGMRKLVGLAGSGHLVSEDDKGRLQIWHPSEPVGLVSLEVPGSIRARWLVRDNVISGYTAHGRSELKLAPEEWFAQVCQAVGRPFREEELKTLPEGADTGPPCAER
ncbi:trypsin-like peptidase domain-containing protein [Crossiella sp. CA-258035]|uniref:nSTAND1 domain-containing NTPase n=1 Tax=Crossiella sp. CA-258035 TaxID=2981138 RepID=UPI0024BCAD5C|nr:trypsin-like peptidase domain-containing protein [Crossiella sp. CA-258035]WHT23191.1 trypsin-like peptidase domain-containing protein [Crossiella sp. CA-258035]